MKIGWRDSNTSGLGVLKTGVGGNRTMHHLLTLLVVI